MLHACHLWLQVHVTGVGEPLWALALYCVLIQKLNSDCLHLAHTNWPWWEQVVKEHGVAPHFAALRRCGEAWDLPASKYSGWFSVRWEEMQPSSSWLWMLGFFWGQSVYQYITMNGLIINSAFPAALRMEFPDGNPSCQPLVPSPWPQATKWALHWATPWVLWQVAIPFFETL